MLRIELAERERDTSPSIIETDDKEKHRDIISVGEVKCTTLCRLL